jgi:hypothetical protein
VKRSVVIGIVTVAALVAVAAGWFWRYSMAVLTPAELTSIIHPPSAPHPVDCSTEVSRIQALSSTPAGSKHVKAIKSIVPLSEDGIAIYRAVIEHWVEPERTFLEVSRRTYPLDATSIQAGPSYCGCVQGIYLENSSAFHSFHELTPDVLPGKRMRLVDPERQSAIGRDNDPDKTIREGKTVHEAVKFAEDTGLFSLSEIAFDPGHRYALVSYSFWCGLLCGNGATLVFEKVGGMWKVTDRQCGGWVS